jgi:hypothetical protein
MRQILFLSFPYSSAGSQSNEMSGFGQNGSYYWNKRSFCAHNRLDSDFDLNQHSRNPARVFFYAGTGSMSFHRQRRCRAIFFNSAEPGAHKAQEPLSVECFFHCNYEDQWGFKWTGPHPLSISTLADDLFLYMSAFFLCDEVCWVEFRLARFDQSTGETVGEHLFFLPRAETMIGNLYRVREQMLNIISRAAFEATAPCFRLSLWPRTEPLSFSDHSTLFPIATLPLKLSLDPSFCIISW